MRAFRYLKSLAALHLHVVESLLTILFNFTDTYLKFKSSDPEETPSVMQSLKYDSGRRTLRRLDPRKQAANRDLILTSLLSPIISAT